MADGHLNFDTSIDSKGFSKGVSNISGSLGGLRSMLGKIAGAAAAAFSVKMLVSFGKQAIETASDMAEVQNVVDTAFGSMSGKMEDFADTSIKQFGISRLAAKQTGSTFMAMASGMGLAQDSASDMAISLTGLSADMASFYNVEQEVASTALKSIFTGETETLKQFGIVMTDANLQAYALSQGISKNTSEMTQAEKVQLRYNYVMSQTALAQGDFAKTSDGWANQTRILSEQWKEFSSVIGTVLMNVLLPAVRTINSALSELIGWAQGAASAAAEVFGIDMSSGTSASGALAADTAELAGNSDTAADSYAEMADSAEKAAEANENSVMGFDRINKLGDSKGSSDGADMQIAGGTQTSPSVTPDVDTSGAEKKLGGFFDGLKKSLGSVHRYFDTNFSGIFSDLWGGLEGEGTELVGILSGVFSDIKSLAEPLKRYLSGDFTVYLQTVFSTVGNIAVGLFDTFNRVFSDIWNIAVYPIISNFLSVGLPLITQFYTQVWSTLSVLFDSIKQIFDTLWTEAVCPVLGFIAQLWCDVWQLISDFWTTWGQPIFDGIKTAIITTKDIILNIWETILRPILDNLMEIIDRIWTEHLQPLIAEFLDFVGELITGATEIYNKFIAPIVNWLVDVLGPIVAKVVNGIAEKVGIVISGIIDAVKGVITTLKGIVQFITGVFTGNWKKAWQGVKNIFKGIWDKFAGIAKIPINLIIGMINNLTGAIENAINWIIDGINSISVDVPDGISDLVGFDTIGFNLSNIDIPEIPKLATGAVIPPNSEFLAILGDQKHGTNIEAPLDTITQAVLQALVAYGGTGGDQKVSVTIPVSLNGRVISQLVIDDINDFIKRNGRSPIKA